MAKEDFCFTYYDGDACRDMSHMTRLERGGYNDIIINQRKFGRLTIDQIRKALGRDFEEIWPSINLVLTLAEDGRYYIGWLEKSVMEMRAHAKKQSGNRKGKTKQEPDETKQEPKPNQKNPLKNGDVDGFINNKNESPEFHEYEGWAQHIIDGTDQHFEQMLMKERLPVNGQLKDFVKGYVGLLAQYPNKEPPDQHRFRVAVIEHIRKELKQPNVISKGTKTTIGQAGPEAGKDYGGSF